MRCLTGVSRDKCSGRVTLSKRYSLLCWILISGVVAKKKLEKLGHKSGAWLRECSQILERMLWQHSVRGLWRARGMRDKADIVVHIFYSYYLLLDLSVRRVGYEEFK
ncbi:MAG: hypothetical protein QXV72_05470 [Sulfolobales archaeon]